MEEPKYTQSYFDAHPDEDEPEDEVIVECVKAVKGGLSLEHVNIVYRCEKDVSQMH
jgi:hypothetical protein